MGPAYSNEADYLLLNVRAGQMGAFSEDPERFLTWAQERGARADRSAFLPRRLFRDYIVDLMRDAWQARTNGPLFEHACGEVTDIETKGGCATIHMKAQEPFVVDRGILALGNFPPRHPPIENRMALQSTSLGLRHLLRERNFASGVVCDAITPGRAPAEAKTDTAVVP